MNRKLVAIKNSLVNVGAQLVNLLLSFVIRKLFIQYIGIEYLGISTVLAEVLGFLSLTELGVQSAIVFRLYKPLVQKDNDVISEIISLLKRVYGVIGIIILIAGIGFTPFLRFVVKDLEVQMQVVYISYYLLLLSSVVTYFLAYKRTLLYADQKQYVTSMVDAVMNLCFSICRILCIVVLKDYYLYIAMSLVQNIISNVVVHRMCKKYYPELKTNIQVSKELKDDLFNDVKNIFSGKIAGYVYSSTDNLVISSIIGTGVVGYLGNYKSVTKAVNTIIGYCVSSMQPLVGNYIASETKENSYNFFKNYSFFRYFIASILLIPTLSLIEPFICWWVGKDYLLNYYIPILIIIDLYISCVHGSTGEFITGCGLFKYEKSVCIIGAALNVITSIVGALVIGIEGVLLGTVVSQIIMWLGRSWIVYKYCFQYALKKYIEYWIKEAIYASIFVLEYIIIKNGIALFQLPNNLIVLIIKGLMAVVVCVIIHTMFLGKTSEYQYFKNWIVGILAKLTRKNKQENF